MVCKLYVVLGCANAATPPPLVQVSLKGLLLGADMLHSTEPHLATSLSQKLMAPACTPHAMMGQPAAACAAMLTTRTVMSQLVMPFTDSDSEGLQGRCTCLLMHDMVQSIDTVY